MEAMYNKKQRDSAVGCLEIKKKKPRIACIIIYRSISNLRHPRLISHPNIDFVSTF